MRPSRLDIPGEALSKEDLALVEGIVTKVVTRVVRKELEDVKLGSGRMNEDVIRRVI